MKRGTLNLSILLFIASALGQIITVHKPDEMTPTLTKQQIAITSSLSTNPTNIGETQNFAIKLQRSPIYAYPGIIVDFLVTPAIERTQSQIEDMIWFDVSDIQYLPPRAYISQGQSPEQIRVVFDYENDIPYKPFVTVFRFQDKARPNFGQKRIALVFDSVLGGISSALHLDQKREDYIR